MANKMELEYARGLAVNLWRKHHHGEAPNWEPLGDLMGLLTQIDNMTACLIRKPPPVSTITMVERLICQLTLESFDDDLPTEIKIGEYRFSMPVFIKIEKTDELAGTVVIPGPAQLERV